LGRADETPPIQCPKCGIFFGRTASTKPIIRSQVIDPRKIYLRFLVSLFAPPLIYWIVGKLAEKGVEMPLFPGAVLLEGLGLLGFGIGCWIYSFNQLARMERGIGWLIAIPIFALVSFADVIFFAWALS
jgi:hypothetical protein